MTRRYFKLTAGFGPEQLFRALREACEERGIRKEAPEFEFDWLKRRVELSAKTEDGARNLLERFRARVKPLGAPEGILLAGDVVARGERFAIPIGVLVNPPETFVQLIMMMLMEVGVVDVRAEFDGNGLSFAESALARTMAAVDLVCGFPLPAYISLSDEGTRG